MRCLITGAAGFIGHHVLQFLLERTDWQFTLIDRLDFSGNLNRLAQLNLPKERVKFHFHDLRAAFNDQQLKQLGSHDYIIHMAASTHVDRSLSDPLLFVEDNVFGTAHLLEYARKTGCAKFINFSTDEVFGPAPKGYAHKEEEPYHPSNPYAASKAGAAAMGIAYFVSFKVPVMTTYTMNNFGERQHPEKLIPLTISRIAKGLEIPVYAHQTPRGLEPIGSRFWMHARNTASAIHFLLEKGSAGEAYNIISFDEWENIDLVRYIGEVMGKKAQVKMVDYYTARPGHDTRYALDGSKLAALGYKPEFPFTKALERTIAFSLSHQEWLL